MKMKIRQKRRILWKIKESYFIFQINKNKNFQFQLFNSMMSINKTNFSMLILINKILTFMGLDEINGYLYN